MKPGQEQFVFKDMQTGTRDFSMMLVKHCVRSEEKHLKRHGNIFARGVNMSSIHYLYLEYSY